MQYRKLGNSSLTVSAVALGCMTFTGDSNWGPQEERDSIETVRAALDAGITLFDTAEGYANGYTEEVLGRALGADRNRILIASKVSNTHLGKKELVDCCENSLRRLGTDHLDLYQIHWPSRTIPIEETIGALENLKQAGKIREYGVSNFGCGDLGDLPAGNAVVSDQLAFNLLFRGIEYSVLPACRERRIGILTYSSLAQGLLSGKYRTADEFPEGRARTKIFAGTRTGARHGLPGCEDAAFRAIDSIREICLGIGQPMADVALAWSIAQPGISAVIAGGRTAAQALENARGGNLTLSPETVAALSAATEEVKRVIGDDADPWSFGRIR